MISQIPDQADHAHPVLSGLAEGEPPGEPAWLSTARRQARRWLGAHGFPTRKDEDWRYFDLEPLLSQPFTPSTDAAPRTGSIDIDSLAGPGLGGPRLVLVNGRFSASLSRLTLDRSSGTHVTSLATEIRAGTPRLQRRWAAPEGGYAHSFEALNAALAVDGAFIELAPDAAFGPPIEIVYVTAAAGGLPLASPRTLIAARAGSRATIVETHVTVGTGRSLSNTHTRVVLAPGAQVEHYRIQAEGPEAFHLSTVEVQAGGASRFASRTLALGALLARHEVRARLVYPSAEVQLDGLYLPDGRQCHDNPVLVDHAAPGCTSRQLYKGIVSGAGHGIFNGHVIVRPDATGTEAHQTNKNLLLSDRAEVDTRPRLEIFTDEVSATHGAAVGQLDEDALFYLRSRGIPQPAARAILVAGFAADVIERFAPGPIRQRADQLLAARLQEAEGEPGQRGGSR